MMNDIKDFVKFALIGAVLVLFVNLLLVGVFAIMKPLWDMVIWS